MASLIFSIIIDFLVLTSAELWEGVNVVAAVLVDKRVDLGEGGKENWTFLLLQIPPLILGRCCASPTAADPPHIQAAMSNFSELSRNVYYVVVSSLYCSTINPDGGGKWETALLWGGDSLLGWTQYILPLAHGVRFQYILTRGRIIKKSFITVHWILPVLKSILCSGLNQWLSPNTIPR